MPFANFERTYDLAAAKEEREPRLTLNRMSIFAFVAFFWCQKTDNVDAQQTLQTLELACFSVPKA